MAKIELLTHPKWMRLEHHLRDIPRAHLLGYFELMIHSTYAQGHPDFRSADDVEFAAGWIGEPGRYTEALSKWGFLDILPGGGYRIHDWLEHSPRTVQRRESVQRWAGSNGIALPAQASRGGTDGMGHKKGNSEPHADVNGRPADACGRPPDVRSHPTQTQTQTQTLDTQPAIPASNLLATQDSAFDAFWKMYPRKKAKGEALKAWRQLKPSKGTIEEIMAGLQRARASRDWAKDGGTYIPYPATWLRALGWQDEDGPELPFEPPPDKDQIARQALYNEQVRLHKADANFDFWEEEFLARETSAPFDEWMALHAEICCPD